LVGVAVGWPGCRRARPVGAESSPPDAARPGSPLGLPGLPEAPASPTKTAAERPGPAGSRTSASSTSAPKPVVASSPVAWASDLEQALSLAKRRHQPVLLLFSAQDAGGTRELRTAGVSDPEVADLVKNMVCCDLSVDVYPELAKEFSITAVPTVVILAPDRTELHSFQGYGSPTRLAAELRRGLSAFGSG